MAVKYYVDEKTKKTVAVLEGCKWDAINRINKLINDNRASMYTVNKDFMMPDVCRAVVTCQDGDEYSVEEGKRQAKQKLLSNYHNMMDKRLAKFRELLVKHAEALKNEKA